MRSTPLVFVTTTLLLTTLAGCLGGTNNGEDEGETVAPEVPVDWALRALDNIGEHNHGSVSDHVGRSTPNFETLGWDPLSTDYHGGTSGGYLCGDVSETGERRIGVVHSFDTDIALVTVDLTNITAPQKLGELVLPHTFVYDVAITPDANFALLATNDPDAAREKGPTAALSGLAVPLASIQTTTSPVPVWRDGCTGSEHVVPMASHLDGAEFGPGVVLVDIRDPSAPSILDYQPLAGLGAHSVFATQFDDEYRVLASVTNLQQQASYYAFLDITTTPLGVEQLLLQSTFAPMTEAETNPPVINGHVDGWIQVHPGTERKLAFLANWDGGLIIVDVENPLLPEEVGRWSDYAGLGNVPYDDNSGSIHEALPMTTLWGDRHYTIIGQEVLGPRAGATTGAVFVMDTTDPTNPHPVSAWTMPAEGVWDEGILFSTHYVTVDDRMLFVTMYHGGVWAVDLSDPENPRSRGVYVPANEEASSVIDRVSFDWSPVVLEAEVIAPGVLTVWDGNSGVYTVAFDKDMFIPEVEEWAIAVS